MNMRDNIPITIPNRRGRPACLPLCNDVYPICGVSLQQGVAGNAPTVVAICKTGKFRGETGRRHGEQGKQSPQTGRHAGLPLHIRNSNVGATVKVAPTVRTQPQETSHEQNQEQGRQISETSRI